MRQIERKRKFVRIHRTIKRVALGGIALSIFSLYLLESTDKSIGMETAALLGYIAMIAVNASVCTAIYLICKRKEQGIKDDIKRAIKRWEK